MHDEVARLDWANKDPSGSPAVARARPLRGTPRFAEIRPGDGAPGGRPLLEMTSAVAPRGHHALAGSPRKGRLGGGPVRAPRGGQARRQPWLC